MARMQGIFRAEILIAYLIGIYIEYNEWWKLIKMLNAASSKLLCFFVCVKRYYLVYHSDLSKGRIKIYTTYIK